jgi:stage II sporulation protein D
MIFIILTLVLCIGLPYVITSVFNTGSDGPDVNPLKTPVKEDEEPGIRVKMADGSIVTMKLEEYVAGAVVCEMPAEYPMEALKAQAVAARTYAYKRLTEGSSHDDCDLCTDPAHCQGFMTKDSAYERWGKGQDAYWNKILKAVRETRGMVLTYDGKPIDCVYHANSGGRTENAHEVWGERIPYLVSVESYWDLYDERLINVKYVSSAEFVEIMNREFSASLKLNELEKFTYSKTYTAGNSIEYLSINGKEIKGTDIRKAFDLRSGCFYTEIIGDSMCFITKGRGHGVGMSQFGAGMMAKNGSDFSEILYHYYQGTLLKKIFS